ncbi:MAG TPA: glutamate racemase [Anaerovoracaceae bacterium]|nr:glutamate racemase [Anaerovoracaceae bacterium]
MNNRPIGFFDSGLGGLTCIPHLMKALPEEKIIYFGDTARTPYGSKAVSTIKSFSIEIADFLVKQDVKMIVIACNTVSATSLEDLKQRFPQLPIIGIIEPATVKTAALSDNYNKIGIIGTKVTIKSGIYEKLIKKLNPEQKIFSVACPAFVPLIEEGIINHDIMNLTIKYYLEDFIKNNNIDTLVLGCTHYPLIRKNIEKIYPDLKIIDPSEIVISTIVEQLVAKNLVADEPNYENVFYASDLSENFMNMIDRIFENSKVKVKFKSFDLEEFRMEGK